MNLAVLKLILVTPISVGKKNISINRSCQEALIKAAAALNYVLRQQSIKKKKETRCNSQGFI